MCEEPKLSIIVPVYNVKKYLKCCIDSILGQTFKDFELILVDDGSNDGSQCICDEYAKLDDRILVIHKENGGASTARNYAIDIAKGDYIGFVDSDDCISKYMFQSLLNALDGSEKKIACCYSVSFKGDNIPNEPDVSGIKKELNVSETLDAIFSFKIGTSVWRRLFKKEVFKEIRFPEGEINEEYPLIIPTTIAAGGTVVIEDVLYYYRDREDSVTGNLHTSLRTLECVAKNLDVMESQFEKYNLPLSSCFSLFSAKNSYYMLLAIDKNYFERKNEVSVLYEKYLNNLKTYKKDFLSCDSISIKDKVLFCLVIGGIYGRLISLVRRKK